MGILGKRSEAIKLFKNAEVELSGMDGVKAAEILVMLVEAADDKFGGVIGRGDEIRADGVGKLRPVAFEEVKDNGGGRGSLDEGVFEGEDSQVVSLGLGRGVGVKDVINEIL